MTTITKNFVRKCEQKVNQYEEEKFKKFIKDNKLDFANTIIFRNIFNIGNNKFSDIKKDKNLMKKLTKTLK